MSPVASSNDRGAELIVVCWSISAVALMFVMARIYTRIKLKSAAGKDDLAIVLAMVNSALPPPRRRGHPSR